MFGRFIYYFFVALIVVDLYIFFFFIRKLTKKTILRFSWFLPTVLLSVGLYFTFYLGEWREYRNIFTFIFIALTAPKIVFTVISIPDLLVNIFSKRKIYLFSKLGFCCAIFACCIVIYGNTFGKTHFKVKHVEFYSPKLPSSFDGYRVVQISDLHLGGWNGDKKPFTELVELVNKQQPNAVMVTGDLVHNSANELDGYETILSSIKATDGVYSVLGNHDYGTYRRWSSQAEQNQNISNLKKRQADLGWKLLNNENTYIKRGSDRIAIVGVENAGSRGFPNFSDMGKAISGLKSSDFKLLLSHDPTHWRREVLKTDIDLMLAGHTHGMQFSLFGYSFASINYPEWGGLYTEKDQGLYVNVGIGFVMLPFRYGAWPEITVITLKCL